MRRYADLGKAHHQIFGNTVIQDTFAGYDTAPAITGGEGVVLEILDQGSGFGPLEKDFALAFIDLSASCHFLRPVTRYRLCLENPLQVKPL